ncbi:hypothetical protein [Sulfurospirillum arsenophilum]|uniref:hypothetical protein n=1 Tax=Sulfurospirillum arsenophilum TaxID=56698 RepID=UPI0005A882FB|nr:hypothetical protein [Sulfurospirillum arsenophilum]
MVNAVTPDKENRSPLTNVQDRQLNRINTNIKYINENEKEVKVVIRSSLPNKKIMIIDDVLEKILNSEFQFIALQNINQLEKYDRALEDFRNSIHAFLRSNNETSQNALFESAENIKNVIDEILNVIPTISVNEPIEEGKIIIENDYVEKTLENLEFKISLFLEQVYPNDIKTINTKIENSESEKKLNQKLEEIDKRSSDSKELFGVAQQSLLDLVRTENLVNNEIQELKRAKEGHIAYTLSDKLEEKLSNCRIDKYFKLALLCIVIIGMLIINYNLLDFSINSIKESKFWELLTMKILFNIPLAFLVIFFLNEYNKAKRLFEEFDYKIIMAQTLMNNYNRLKKEFLGEKDLLETKEQKIAKEEKLLEIFKSPIEKIFENPVHSVFGDKSGDKGLGIEQLEKLVSIASKLKDKKD